MKDYKISIPFSAFLTANSILIAADFVLLQLWINFQEPKCETQWEAVAIAAIFVFYFVVLSIVSMILAILWKVKTKDGYEVNGLPVILFFFSLGFTMVFVFQAIVTHAIKVINQDLLVNRTLYQHSCLPWFIGLFFFVFFVTIAAIVLTLRKSIKERWYRLKKYHVWSLIGHWFSALTEKCRNYIKKYLDKGKRSKKSGG